jgi:serine/threonine protein kinase
VQALTAIAALRSLAASPAQVKDLGSGNFGLARLEREIATGELVAIKYIERGHGVRWPLRARTRSDSPSRAAPQRARPRLARPRAPPAPRHGRVLCAGAPRGGSAQLSNALRASGRPLGLSVRAAARRTPLTTALARQIDENVAREIICHRMLRHHNIVLFKEARAAQRRHSSRAPSVLAHTPPSPPPAGAAHAHAPGHRHGVRRRRGCPRPCAQAAHALTGTFSVLLLLVAGGELFDRICSKGRFSEDEARYFFQQLIAGINYCHGQSIAHRDLKARASALSPSQSALQRSSAAALQRTCVRVRGLRRASSRHRARSWRMRCWMTHRRQSSRFATSGALPSAHAHASAHACARAQG